jgi:hypothetical protein
MFDLNKYQTHDFDLYQLRQASISAPFFISALFFYSAPFKKQTNRLSALLWLNFSAVLIVP